jgi:glycosyltransferase involved in cell wall biosynthesis
MAEISKLVERGTWQLRHTASRCLSKLEEGLGVAESIAERNHERLIILDEFFPSLFTAFRIAEFNSILQHFPAAVIYSSRTYRADFRTYAKHFPELARRVRRFSSPLRLRGAAYVVFLNNIIQYIDKIEGARLPFVLELYPGGGLLLDHPKSDTRMSRVFESPFFRKVIVTQNVTRDYLLRKKFCRADQIEFIFGVVVSSNVLNDDSHPKIRYGLDKKTLDICFVANKNVPRGADKGYDRFIEAARILGTRHSQVRFHVVGQLTEKDVEVGDFSNKITFYGHQPTSFFPQFHSRMDIILSPNIPFVLYAGAFDGFPTGASVEAALCGTALFVTDELGMNDGYFKDGEEIVIISREPEQIVDTIEKYIAEPERLSSIGQNGQRAARQIFSLEVQMAPRLRVLANLMDSSKQDRKLLNSTL